MLSKLLLVKFIFSNMFLILAILQKKIQTLQNTHLFHWKLKFAVMMDETNSYHN